jgi:hypothetical protein
MVLFGLIGCSSPNIAPRPPKHPEEIVVPPIADGRFSNPPVYPEPINQNIDPTRSPNGMGAAGGQPNLGAMNGMGGMGGMGPMGMGARGMGAGGYNGRGY